MGETELYREGLREFRDDVKVKNDHDRALLRDFLEESATPLEAKQQADDLRDETQLKYGKDVSKIPKSWIDNILGNINRFIAVGDYAMKGAPESIGIAWMVTKLTLSAIQNNYELYGYFGEGLTTITEVMTILPHYDKMYDTRSTQGQQVDDFMRTLYSDLRSAYSAVLQFCFAIKRHVKGRKRDHAWHGVKDFFGADKSAFQEKLELVITQKNKVIDGSNGAFQKRVFEQFTGMESLVTSLRQDIQGIQEFSVIARELRQEQRRLLLELGAGLVENVKDSVKESFKELARPKTPWEVASDKYEKHMKPLSSSQDVLRVAADHPAGNRASWIPENELFQAWVYGSQNTFLLVVGKSGSGRTSTASAMLDLIAEAHAFDAIMLSVSGNMASRGELGQRSQNFMSKITTALMHQLYSAIYRLAEADGKNADLLTKSIDAYRSPKQEKSSKASRIDRREDGPSLADISRIVRVLPKSVLKVFLVFDCVDEMDRAGQEELSKIIIGLTDTSGDEEHGATSSAQISALVTCFRTSPFFGMVDNRANYIDLASETRTEMGTTLETFMQDIPGLSTEVIEEAKKVILEKASGRFNYLTDVVRPFIRLPYQGSFLHHLDDLPDTANETYIQAVQSLDAGSVGLLRSALSMTLYGNMTVKVQEILDYFSGTYLAPLATQNGTTNIDEASTERPIPSKLQIEQVERATEPFLKIWHDLDDIPYVELQDPIQVRRFCDAVTTRTEGEPEERAVCAKCAKAVHATHALAFSEREWHLDLALRCLKHLNHPLFQKRYGLSKAATLETDASDEPDSAETAADTAPRNGGSEPAKPDVDNSEVTQDEEAGIDVAGPGSHIPLPPEEAAAQPSNTAAASADEAIESSGDRGEITTAKETETTCDVDSVLDERDATDDGPSYVNPEVERWGISEWASSRYEIDQWSDHLFLAEKLWPDREERLANASWQEVLRELDAFTTVNRSAFELWQTPVFARNGADAPDQPWTPLNMAAVLGLTTWAERLMDEHGADPKEVISGRNALQAAAFLSNNQDMLGLLLERGVDPNLETEGDIPAFHSWIWTAPTLEAVEAFLKHGGDPSKVTEQHQRSLLHILAINGEDEQVLMRLLQHDDPAMKPKINAVNFRGETALQRLLYRAPVPIALLKAFIANGASIDMEDEDSERPLQSACRFGDRDVVEVLLEKNEDVNDPDNSGRNAMHQAARGGHRDCIDLLVGAGADPHAMDHHGRSPLFYACIREDGDAALHILKILCECKRSGTDINAPTQFGQTPLRQAAGNGLTDVVAALLTTLENTAEASDDILNKTDAAYSRSAVHLAVKNGHADVVRFLVEKKADVTLRDSNDKTALTLCTELWALTQNTSFEEIACVLVEADPAAAAGNSELAATAAMNGSKRVLECLQKAGADLNTTDRFGWSPLALAKHFGGTDAEEYLRQQTAWAKGLPVRWSGARDGTTLSEDGLFVRNALETKFCLSTEQPLPSGLERYYFEVTSRRMEDVVQEEYPIVAIGFCTHDAKVLVFPGWAPKPYAPSARSWAYHGDDGGYFSNRILGHHNGEDRKYKPGDTVGCGFDLKSKTIWFTRNGELMQPPFEDVGGRMFPVIGLQHAVELETNFGSKPFRWREGGAVADAAQESLEGRSASMTLVDRTVVDTDTGPGAEHPGE